LEASAAKTDFVGEGLRDMFAGVACGARAASNAAWLAHAQWAFHAAAQAGFFAGAYGLVASAHCLSFVRAGQFGGGVAGPGGHGAAAASGGSAMDGAAMRKATTTIARKGR
jgi:hypothetical protein